jgi:hypothetical protein
MFFEQRHKIRVRVLSNDLGGGEARISFEDAQKEHLR